MQNLQAHKPEVSRRKHKEIKQTTLSGSCGDRVRKCEENRSRLVTWPPTSTQLQEEGEKVSFTCPFSQRRKESLRQSTPDMWENIFHKSDAFYQSTETDQTPSKSEQLMLERFHGERTLHTSANQSLSPWEMPLSSALLVSEHWQRSEMSNQIMWFSFSKEHPGLRLE